MINSKANLPQRHRDTEINQCVLRVSLCLCVSVVKGFGLVKTASMSVIEMMQKNLSPQRHRDTEVKAFVLRVSLCLCVSVVNGFNKGLQHDAR